MTVAASQRQVGLCISRAPGDLTASSSDIPNHLPSSQPLRAEGLGLQSLTACYPGRSISLTRKFRNGCISPAEPVHPKVQGSFKSSMRRTMLAALLHGE